MSILNSQHMSKLILFLHSKFKYNAHFKAQARESRARRLSEMQRMARQAIEEAIEAKRVEKEAKKIEILKAGVCMTNLKGIFIERAYRICW